MGNVRTTDKTEMHWPTLTPYVIGPNDDPYMHRWFLVPKNDRIGGVYLHRFFRSDDDRALHDHPRHNLSILLWGSYREHLTGGIVKLRKPWRPWAPWRVIVRSAATAHRIELIDGRSVWTLFITGPHIREWGFWCARGWIHWTEFAETRPGGNAIGKGCGE